MVITKVKKMNQSDKKLLKFLRILSWLNIKNQLINLSISWKDPKLLPEWANDLVKQLNEQLRERAISDSQKKVGYLNKN